MRSSALQYLACPECGGSLIADAGPAPSDQSGAHDSIDDGHIMSGTLLSSCGARFPIRRGVPRLVPGSAELDQDDSTSASIETAARFSNQWAIFDQKASYYEQQFLDWIAPLAPRDFTDRVVLEGGCGKGRHTSLVASFGAKAIVAIDLGNAVDVAFAATRHLHNVHIVQGDVIRPPVARVFDLGFSIGVLHHLPDPRAGFRGLYGRIRPGGRVAFWVYGYESNEWIVRYVDPLRRTVTSRMPERMLYWLSLPPAAALRMTLPAYRWPSLADRLPYGAYLGYLSRFPLREVHNIVFDQLVTPVAHYLPREEIERWLATDDLGDTAIRWHNRNSWRASATVRGHGDHVSHDMTDKERK